MARRRKSSNNPLAFLITAFLMIPFALAAIFKLLFKGISCLASFIGKCIEKRRLKQQTYTYNTSNSYHSQSRYYAESNRTTSDNSSYQTSQRFRTQSTSQNTEQRKSTCSSNSHASSYSSLYEALRIPGDPDPDFTMSSAPDFESYDEYFDDPDDSNTVFEEIEEIVPDEEDVIFDELENLDIDESDLTIMGLALYDMLTNEDNN